MATLGNLLSRTGGTAITGRRVTFRLLRRDQEHRLFVVDAAAILFPVSADQEIEVLAAAAEACKRNLQHEQRVQVAARFLAASLRDPDRPHVAFVAQELINAFVASITADELERLQGEYRAYLADEYGPVDEPKTTEQALGFSMPDQAQRSG